MSEATALRINASNSQITFSDQVQGLIKQTLNDFIIFRKDAVAAYHLAVVVDDNEQAISHILRGHDLLSSTPSQIFLQQQLASPRPSYAHIPVITDPKGAKLSKQTFAKAVSSSQVEVTLLKVMALLNLAPPTELSYASPREILDWGLAHWQLSKVKQQASILLQ